MNIKEYHSASIRNAENYYIRHFDLPPTLIALQSNGEMFICFKPFENPKQKEYVFFLYSALLKLKKCTMYSFISEAWFYTSSEEGPHVAPSEHPNKKECLFIYTISKAKSLFNGYEIKRGEKILLQPMDWPNKWEETGTVTKLFTKIDNHPNLNGLLDGLKLFENNFSDAEWYLEINKDDFLRGTLND